MYYIGKYVLHFIFICRNLPLLLAYLSRSHADCSSIVSLLTSTSLYCTHFRLFFLQLLFDHPTSYILHTFRSEIEIMEPTGLALGVLSLTGLFNNALDCFEYVLIGRNFGKSFQTSLLKLDVARLRLSRWGQAVGLGPSLDGVQSLQQTQIPLLSVNEINQAEQILGQILDLFADAEGISQRFKKRRNAHYSGDLVVHDATTDLQPVQASLHQKMRELALRRQGQTGLRQKAKWALCEEKHFSWLIEDVTGLVNDLVDLFPAAEATQRQLCDVEVSEIVDNDRDRDGGSQDAASDARTSLPLLKEAAADQDRYLDAAISKAMARIGPSASSGSASYCYTATFSGGNNSGFQLGHNSGSISGLRWGGAV